MMDPVRGNGPATGSLDISAAGERAQSEAADVPRGRSRQRQPSTDVFEHRSPGALSPAWAGTAPVRGPSSSRGPVHFPLDLPEREAGGSPSARRRHSVRDDATSLVSQWATLREQIGHEAQLAACHGIVPPHDFAAGLEQVQAFVQRCAEQVSLARKRARMSLAQLRCISDSAKDLQGHHGLAPDELQFDETNPESMAAAVRSLLGALDSGGPNGPRTLRTKDAARARSASTRLSFDGDASDTEWVECSGDDLC